MFHPQGDRQWDETMDSAQFIPPHTSMKIVRVTWGLEVKLQGAGEKMQREKVEQWLKKALPVGENLLWKVGRVEGMRVKSLGATWSDTVFIARTFFLLGWTMWSLPWCYILSSAQPFSWLVPKSGENYVSIPSILEPFLRISHIRVKGLELFLPERILDCESKQHLTSMMPTFPSLLEMALWERFSSGSEE